MAITYVTLFRDFAEFASSKAVTVPGGGVAAGSLVVVAVCAMDAASLSSVADSAGNTYTVEAATDAVGSGPTEIGAAWSILSSPLTAGQTVTPTISSGVGLQAIVAVFSGVTATSPRDQVASQSTDFTSSHASPSVNTTQADEVLIGVHGYRSNGTNAWTATGSFTVPTNGDYDPTAYAKLVLQYRIVSSTGSYASTGTTNSDTKVANAIVTFKADTGAAVGNIAWVVA